MVFEEYKTGPVAIQAPSSGGANSTKGSIASPSKVALGYSAWESLKSRTSRPLETDWKNAGVTMMSEGAGACGPWSASHKLDGLVKTYQQKMFKTANKAIKPRVWRRSMRPSLDEFGCSASESVCT